MYGVYIYPRQTPPGQTSHHGQTYPPSGQTPPETATAADGTHPTGMHSCLDCVQTATDIPSQWTAKSETSSEGNNCVSTLDTKLKLFLEIFTKLQKISPYKSKIILFINACWKACSRKLVVIWSC